MRQTIINFLSIFIWNIGFHRHEIEHAKKYYHNSVNNPNKIKKGIVVMVDGRQIHGGFADRLRGITTIYQFCKNYNQPFSIFYSAPFRIEEYLTPVGVNWICTDHEIAFDSRYARPVMLEEWMLPHKYHKFYLRLCTLFCKNKQLQVYTNSHFYYSQFSKQFAELFKPTPRLQKTIDENKKKIGKKYIAMVFRFQQLLGDFNEGNFKVLTESEQKELINKCILKVIELWNGKSRILVTSDSRKFLNEIDDKLEFVYTIQGKVVHIDYTKNATYEIYEKSFVDFFMIAEAQKVYLLKTDEMYQSGFPKTASKIYGRNFETITF